MKKIKIILVDDHNIVRDGLKILLLNLPDIEVIGEAANDKVLLELLVNIKPDILLMDIALPDMSGISITRKVHHDYPDIKVIMLTANANEESIFNSLKAGAMGYLPKDILQEELVTAIKSVYEGNEYFAKSITNTILKTHLHKSLIGKTEKPKKGKTAKSDKAEPKAALKAATKAKKASSKLVAARRKSVKKIQKNDRAASRA